MLQGTIISAAMQTATPILLLAAALGCASLPAAAQDRIFIQVPALMDAGAKLDPDVRAECNLPVLVGRQVLQQVYRRHPGAIALDPSAPGSERFIRVHIVSATSMPGVGMRQISALAEVVEDGKVVASRRINDRTSATPGIGMRLCDVMEHVADGIGKRVAVWADTAYLRPVPASAK